MRVAHPDALIERTVAGLAVERNLRHAVEVQPVKMEPAVSLPHHPERPEPERPF